jgi:hypothetical protein
MAPGSDDLEQELLRNLRLRRKLGTEAAETDDLDEIRRELTLKRDLDSADLERVRSELKLRRATDPTFAKSGVVAQREKIPRQHTGVERHTVPKHRKVWLLLAFACVLSIAVMFLLVYRLF